MSSADAKRCLTAMENLRAQYLETVRELERNRKPMEGILGMKGGPADDPCHDRYAESLRTVLTEFAGTKPDSGDLCRVLAELCAVPPRNAPKSAYWMLIAVHSFALELVGGLNGEDAGALRRSYTRDYPRWERLPVQEKLLTALKEAERRG